MQGYQIGQLNNATLAIINWLGSVAGPVIQAVMRPEFEDGLWLGNACNNQHDDPKAALMAQYNGGGGES